MAELTSWKPRTPPKPAGETDGHRFPVVVYRTPSRLVEECQKAYDADLLIAALNLVVTIPDVCAKIAGIDYKDWCQKYLHLSFDGKKMDIERKSEKTQEEVSAAFDEIERRGVFTASDLYQMRCAVVHAGSSYIDGHGKRYTPYRAIGVCANGDASKIVASYRHIGQGIDNLECCGFGCRVSLEGLISRMAEGVVAFIAEDPGRDRELSAEDGEDAASYDLGLVDLRACCRP